MIFQMINYSFYPVLKGSLQHRHITEFDEQSILYAKENIEEYNPTQILNLDLPVWLISTIMLRCLNNNYVTRKFVSNYGKLFESHLIKDIYNQDVRKEILDFFSIKKDLEFFRLGPKAEHIKIHIMDYLEVSEEGLSVSAPQFKLVNQTLSKGFVYLETPRFLYLLRLALEQRLIKKIKSMKDYKDNQLINRCVNELVEKYPRFDGLKAPSKENTPDSIKELISKAYEEHHLSHRERIKLGIFLQRYNYDMDYILDIFRQLSDWNEKVTRYQLNSLKRYIKQ
jgi:DNA primase large subunit